jgi:hypothetical protein
VFRKRPAKRKPFWTRLGIFVSGTFTIFYGLGLLRRGIFVYYNGYHTEIYSPAVAITGALFMVLALIPDSLVERVVRYTRR